MRGQAPASLLFKRGFFQRVDLFHGGRHAVGVFSFVIFPAGISGDLLKKFFIEIALNLFLTPSGERFDRRD